MTQVKQGERFGGELHSEGFSRIGTAAPAFASFGDFGQSRF